MSKNIVFSVYCLQLINVVKRLGHHLNLLDCARLNGQAHTISQLHNSQYIPFIHSLELAYLGGTVDSWLHNYLTSGLSNLPSC
uniref:Uncharacterized protein n=1 Tax=Timema poppense TaxID=170557 RepID=A0A7R9D9F0_TIMPO|nr:unnamed protein product [Timema poppensis]